MTAIARPGSGSLEARLARPTGWWGMALFVLTEALIFSLLLASYFYLFAVSPQWPPAGVDDPELLLPGINTIILLASSVPMVWASRAASRGDRPRVMAGLAVAFVLASIFLAIQFYSLGELDLSYKDNAYGSAFFTVEGVHAAHLLLGLTFVAYALVRTGAGHVTAERHLAIENTAMYWHFVDLVWVFVFLSLHVSPYLLEG